MTELHLDSDEWENILHALKEEHARTADDNFRKYLGATIMKIECALDQISGDS